MAKGAVIKIAGLIACLIITGCVNAVHAQERHLSKKITLSVSNVPLERALASIGEAADFTFSYNADLIEPGKQVTVRAQNKNVDAVITDLLGDRVRKKEIGDHVILVMNAPREEKQKEKLESTVTGIVTEARSGKVIPEATIYEVGGRRSALTRADGTFSITFPDGEKLTGLTICKAGYRDTVVFIRPIADQHLIITLRTRMAAIERIEMQPGTIDLTLSSGRRMTLDSLQVVNAFIPRKLRVNSINLHIFDTWPVQLSFVPYLGTNRKISGSVSNAFSLNLLAGYSGGVRGFELGGLLNIDRYHVRGFQLGGLGNIVGGKTSGFQLGGLFNVNLDRLYGFQLGGLFNVNRGRMTGFQLGGLFNWVTDTIRGAQVAGLFNYVPARWKGAQIAGLVNVSLAQVTGFQLSGLVNISKEYLSGVQIAGLVNVARTQNRGLQIAGLINYTRTLKGVQIALINVASRQESGVPIGFFSHVRQGGYRCAELSADEISYVNIAYKTGTDRLYNIFKAGTNDSLLMNFAYGFGTLFHLGKKTSITLDFTGGMLFSARNRFSWYGALLKLAPAFEYRIAKHFALFAGPTLNYSFYSDAGEQAYPDGFPFYHFYDGYHSGTREQMWAGGIIGLRF